MKRGRDEEKVVGPMFPRLHVNDSEKGGPRAPPRNKMALYEQFSVPSQRFSPRLLPLNPNAPPSSGQGSGLERSYVFPAHSPSQAPSRQESYSSCQYDGTDSNTSRAQREQRKKVDEDDFRVPVYIHSRNGQSNDRTMESFNGRNFTPMDSMNFGCSVAVQKDGDKDPKQFGSLHVRKDVRSESEALPPISSSRQQQVMSVKYISSGETVDGLVRQAKTISNQEYQDCSVSNISRPHQADACLQHESAAGSQSNDNECGEGLLESTRDIDMGSVLVPRGHISTANQNIPRDDNDDPESHDTRIGGPMQEGNLDESDNVSKISTVENLSSLEVSPDDVVGILGQKHFFKARREIANQQRIFAVQVFELHRLIKVQQLIAGSPELLVEDAAFIGKIPVKGSTTKSLSLEEEVEPKQQNLKRKDDSQKLNHKMERSAENAVEKTSLSSQKSGSHLSHYTPFPGNPHQPSEAADNRISPMCFNPSPGHQWLIPVMSPSEGLVYKPYPSPGFTGSMCGGFGPFGPVPMNNTFMNPVYGVPASHEAIGVPPYIPPASHPAYFPPYGMPVMNQAVSGSAAEQANHFAAQGSHVQNGHSSADGANVSAHNQGSSNLLVKRNGSASHVRKSQASKESELQGSSASSPSEMAEGTRTRQQIAEGRDAHSPFLMAPVVSDGTNQSLETGQQTRVIKVVPHNARSATESAARIFRRIQEERKQYDV